MRIIVFFDLPVTTVAKRKAANQFRHFLLKDGYQMLQLSVYSRIVKGRDALQKHHNRLCANLPQEGSIRYTLFGSNRKAVCRHETAFRRTENTRKKGQFRPIIAVLISVF